MALTQKGAAKHKSHKKAHPVKKAKPKAALGSSHKKPVLKQKALPAKAKAKNAAAIRKKKSYSSRRPADREIIVKAESRKPALKSNVASTINASPRLLRETKATSAALALLEKGIEFIYKKEFNRARSELKALLEMYPAETEILARARSYIQICDREEAAQKKPAVAAEQLYALGVVEHNKANYDAAISCFRQSLENHPNADYVYYSVAASLAMKGNVVEAIENLRKAIELNEDSRIYAKNDADFSSLSGEKEFAELVGISQPPEP